MSDLIEAAFDTYIDKIREVQHTQAEAIRQAVEMCSQAMLAGNVVHVHDTGHIIDSELINRAGGLPAFSRFKYNFQVNNENRYREAGDTPHLLSAPEVDRLLIQAAFGRSNARSGDVLVIGTVSGNKFQQVEMALQAQRMGLKVIAVCAAKYVGVLESKHDSGKMLAEVADLVLDNCAPYGDAMIECEGLARKFGPASGIAAAVMMWAVVAGIVEALQAAGTPPAIYPSVNIPEGSAGYKEASDLHIKRGY